MGAPAPGERTGTGAGKGACCAVSAAERTLLAKTAPASSSVTRACTRNDSLVLEQVSQGKLHHARARRGRERRDTSKGRGRAEVHTGVAGNKPVERVERFDARFDLVRAGQRELSHEGEVNGPEPGAVIAVANGRAV